MNKTWFSLNLSKWAGLVTVIFGLLGLLSACASTPTATVSRVELSPTTASTTVPSATASRAAISPSAVPAATVGQPQGVAPPPTAVILPSAIPAPTATVGQLVAAVAGFDGEAAYKHLKVLVDDIGIRAAGTEGHEKAADYIANYFKGLNLIVTRPSVSFENYVDKGSTVRYNGQEFKGTALRLSKGGTLSAPLASGGLALDGQLAKGSLQGKIALIERGQATFYVKAKNAKDAGAIGVIFYNNQPSDIANGTLGQSLDMLVLGITQEAGQKLLPLAEQAITVEIKVDISLDKRSFSNVIGVRPAINGNTNSPIIIIGGHFDSVPAGPGANDNASGIVITMELARVLQAQYPNYELRFIAFGGEEIGLVGSNDYVSKLSQAERQRVKVMLNIDMVTVGSTLYFGGSKNLVQSAFSAANEVGAGKVEAIPDELNGASDHASFARQGIPVLFFYRGDDPNYHRATDTSDKIKPERLTLIGNIVIKVIDSVSVS